MTGEQKDPVDFEVSVHEVIAPISENLIEGIDSLVAEYEVTKGQAGRYCLAALAANLGLHETARTIRHLEQDAGEYISPAEVAKMLHVTPKTVTRYAQTGRIPHITTLGGHRRYQRADIVELMEYLNKPSQ